MESIQYFFMYFISFFYMDLIPKEPTIAFNYWCTWAVQNYTFGQNEDNFDINALEGDVGAQNARNNINEGLLLGDNGWARLIYPKIRKDLFILIDDGWDVPPNTENSSINDFSSFHLNAKKFPSYKGTPQEKLTKLNEKVKGLGWRGIGLWVAAQEALNFLPETQESQEKLINQFWSDRMQWSKEAGILYWKIDWGHKERRIKFRKFLSELAHECYPELVLDHSVPTIPFNSHDGNGRAESSFIKKCVKYLEFSDVLRIYDVSPQLSIPTTLDRLANIMKEANYDDSKMHLISCDDEVYIAAGLGCSMGIMRHPFRGLRPGKDIDLSFEGPRQFKRRIDEVIRAVRWQRIAPPYNAGSQKIILSKEILFDNWQFNKGDTWFSLVIGRDISQGAPAIVARGLELPVVEPDDEAPYVIASYNPNGAISIATLGRTSPNKGYYIPKAKITVSVPKKVSYLGIFGQYEKLTFIFEDNNISSNDIYAQDLAGDNAIRVNERITRNGHELSLKEKFVEDYGLEAATNEDLSEPGLLIYLKE